MRLEVGKLAEITKSFSLLRRKEETQEMSMEAVLREFIISELKAS